MSRDQTRQDDGDGKWKTQDKGECTPERVAVLLVRNLYQALQERCIETADSEPFWLSPEQYAEQDGGIQFFPSQAADLIRYAQEHNFRPLGIMVLAENGDFSDFMDEDDIPREDLDFAKHLFHVHAVFWCFYFPFATAQDGQS
jgi:hypothetical protein